MGYCSCWTSLLLLFLISNTVQGETSDQEKLVDIGLVTIKSEDGDVIHCVNIYKQPALDHPLLQNHTIDMTPSFNPFGNDSTSQEEMAQLWHKINGSSCPEGTVPMIRSTSHGEEQYSSFMSLTGFGNDATIAGLQVRGRNQATGLEVMPSTDRYFAGYTSLARTGPYTAIKGRFSVPSPTVKPGEFSGAFIVVIRGTDMAFLGWAVNVPPHTDGQPRLFLVRTGGRRRSDFVQTSTRIAIGAALPTHGNYHPVFQIYKDEAQQKWWAVCDKEHIGYWPTSVLGTLGTTAEAVGWSGFVYNSAARGHHTTTQMGNGRNPIHGLGNVAFIDDITAFRSSGSNANVQLLTLRKLAPFPRCYSATALQSFKGTRNSVGSLTVLYGGTGSPTCDVM